MPKDPPASTASQSRKPKRRPRQLKFYLLPKAASVDVAGRTGLNQPGECEISGNSNIPVPSAARLLGEGSAQSAIVPLPLPLSHEATHYGSPFQILSLPPPPARTRTHTSATAHASTPRIPVRLSKRQHYPELNFSLPRPPHRSPLSTSPRSGDRASGHDTVSSLGGDGTENQPISFRHLGQRQRRRYEASRNRIAISSLVHGLQAPPPFVLRDSEGPPGPLPSVDNVCSVGPVGSRIVIRRPALLVSASGERATSAQLAQRGRRERERRGVQRRIEEDSARFPGLAFRMPLPPAPSLSVKTVPQVHCSSEEKGTTPLSQSTSDRRATGLVLCRPGAGHTPFCICG
ncbi:hypothetical protein D9619_005282 [Psilocybe cf. subviscida]|uniref:Uncharacterized protein n=1 Tax=Psilocybe cf. subviscida TaxID=2480587 RepID=A0A8H5BX32_9AGAR|nr:hypothetical protein D9619_005282 [Psilocybe cf. subviscida]